MSNFFTPSKDRIHRDGNDRKRNKFLSGENKKHNEGEEELNAPTNFSVNHLRRLYTNLLKVHAPGYNHLLPNPKLSPSITRRNDVSYEKEDKLIPSQLSCTKT
mmetsp:Transcript_34336/g.39724  ORF Transcript_34336/g.39724 Transcript_34336/m.39724 type:complete len:103 (+) Transcript_34336:128-436(+)